MVAGRMDHHHPILDAKQDVPEVVSVASQLRSDVPRMFLLACADLDESELRFPALEPGEVRVGPLYFRFASMRTMKDGGRHNAAVPTAL